jgi:hypothetical protein
MLDQKKIRFFYLRDRKGFPRVCVARAITGNTITFAYTVHNPKDKYSKKLARMIATDRLCLKLSNDEDKRNTGGVVSMSGHDNEHPITIVMRALAGYYEIENFAQKDFRSHSLVSTFARKALSR